MKLRRCLFLKIIGIVTFWSVLISGCQSRPVVRSGHIDIEGGDVRVRIAFSDHDRRVIHQYYGSKKCKKMPPGLAKKRCLPPGLQRHVRKYGKLPPGLEGRRLPQALERRLSPLPRGYIRIIVGTEIVLLDSATRVIVDTISIPY